MKGRKPQPSDLKLLRGNPGRRPANTREPQLPRLEGFETPPPELAGDVVALAEWHRIVPILVASRQITVAERPALIACCQQWSTYLDCHERARAGRVIMTPSGYPRPNPYGPLADSALTQCNRLWAELGLTPSSRSRVHTTGVADTPHDAQRQRYFG